MPPDNWYGKNEYLSGNIRQRLNALRKDLLEDVGIDFESKSKLIEYLLNVEEDCTCKKRANK